MKTFANYILTEGTITDNEFSRNPVRRIWGYSFLTLVGLLALTATTNFAIIQQVKAQAPVDLICGRNAGPTAAPSSFQIAMNNAGKRGLQQIERTQVVGSIPSPHPNGA
jgi:hypothetical protein